MILLKLPIQLFDVLLLVWTLCGVISVIEGIWRMALVMRFVCQLAGIGTSRLFKNLIRPRRWAILLICDIVPLLALFRIGNRVSQVVLCLLNCFDFFLLRVPLSLGSRWNRSLALAPFACLVLR